MDGSKARTLATAIGCQCQWSNLSCNIGVSHGLHTYKVFGGGEASVIGMVKRDAMYRRREQKSLESFCV